MIISVFDLARGEIVDEEMHRAVRATSRPLAQDVGPRVIR